MLYLGFIDLNRTVYRSIFQYIAVYCSISQYIAVCHSISQYIAVYRSTSQYIAFSRGHRSKFIWSCSRFTEAKSDKFQLNRLKLKTKNVIAFKLRVKLYRRFERDDGNPNDISIYRVGRIFWPDLAW